MSLPRVDIVIWWLGVGVHLCLLAVLLVKQRWRQYPVFTSFIVYQNLVTPVLALAYNHQLADLYSELFWLSEALCFLLEVAVSVEMFATIWRKAAPIPQVPWFILMRSGIVSLIVASFSAYGVGTATMSLIDLLAMRGAVFTSLLLCGCFVAISFQANALHLRRSRHAMIIGWGLTGIVLLELSEDFRYFTQGWHEGTNAFDRAKEVLYASIILFWTVGIWRTDIIRWPHSRPARINRSVLG